MTRQLSVCGVYNVCAIGYIFVDYIPYQESCVLAFAIDFVGF